MAMCIVEVVELHLIIEATRRRELVCIRHVFVDHTHLHLILVIYSSFSIATVVDER